MKTGSVYPGFRDYYVAGGWNGSALGWTIAANGTATMAATLDAVVNRSNVNYIQLNTWNDYGEGTMIEPTDSTTGGFGFSLLTTLQQKLGVSTLNQTDLEAVLKLYKLRQTYSADPAKLAALNQVYYYMVSMQMTKAKALLATL